MRGCREGLHTPTAQERLFNTSWSLDDSHKMTNTVVQKYVLHLKDDACEPFSNPSIQRAPLLPGLVSLLLFFLTGHIIGIEANSETRAET